MRLDVGYTNGVIAVKEKSLFGKKLTALAEGTSENAFRFLKENGFGVGAIAETVSEYENLILAEENALGSFILTYAPTKTEEAYFLLDRDFHNAKAFLKAKLLSKPVDGMLSLNGLVPTETFKKAFETGNYSLLPDYLKETLANVKELSEENPDGAKIGLAFEKHYYKTLFEQIKSNGRLKALAQKKLDCLNLLTYVRCGKGEFDTWFIEGGTLQKSEIRRMYETPLEKLKGETDEIFFKVLSHAVNKEYMQAEKQVDLVDYHYYESHKYDLKNKEPFIYYVLSKKTDIKNARILFVCLTKGLPEREIKSRLKG